MPSKISPRQRAGAAVWRHIDGIDDEEIYKNYMLLSLHGQTKDALHKSGIGAWEYDIVEPYFKCNMTDIMASLGLAQLARYDGCSPAAGR